MYRHQVVDWQAEEVQALSSVRDLRPSDEGEGEPPLDPVTRERLKQRYVSLIGTLEHRKSEVWSPATEAAGRRR